MAAITGDLCGLVDTSGQVSRAAEVVGEELQKRRDRPLGETPDLTSTPGVIASLPNAWAR